MPPDGGVPLDIFLGNGGGLGIGGGGALPGNRVAQPGQHAVERPVQVDRRGPRGSKLRRRPLHGVRAGVIAHSQRQAVSRDHPDQRRSADLHAGDGMGGLPQRGQAQEVQRPWELRLVDDADGPAVALVHPNGAVRSAVDLHVRS